MSLYGEVVKLLNKYWITADQLEKPKQLIHSSSVIVETGLDRKGSVDGK